MDTDTAQFQYVDGQRRAHFEALLASHEARNAQARALPGWNWDIPYGPHARERLDLHRTDAAACGTLVYVHAGYWQSRDKAQFHFLAPAFNALGWDVALLNYPLCPEVRVADITAAAAQALRQVMSLQAQRPGAVVLCGHSAGAHLVVELALQQAEHPHAFATPIAGVLAVSGVFDLRPLCHTTLNDKLALDAASAHACSPLLRARPGAAPALFVWGASETSAFHAQSQHMAAQWQNQGNIAQRLCVADADHFSVLDHLTVHDGEVARTLRAWHQAPPRTPS